MRGTSTLHRFDAAARARRLAELSRSGSRLLMLASALLSAVLLGGQGPQASPSPSAVAASVQANNVAVITIRGEIDRVTAMSFVRRLAQAERSGADAVVVELDTPGGEVGAVLEICSALKRTVRAPNSPVKLTVAWINDDAYSGGAIIALACQEIVIAPYCSFGDALPIQANPMVGIVPLSGAERQKVLTPLLAEVVDSARRNGYDEMLVQGLVSTGVELWLLEQPGVPPQRLFVGPGEFERIYGSSPDRGALPAVPAAPDDPSAPPPDAASGTPGGTDGPPRGSTTPILGRGGALSVPAAAGPTQFIPAAAELEAIAPAVSLALEAPTRRPRLGPADAASWRLVEYVSDGRGLIVLKSEKMTRYGLARAVVNNDSDLRAYFGATNIRRLDASWSEALVGFLTNPIVRGLLILIFLLTLFVELVSPGLVGPGLASAVALVLLLAPPFLVGMANWWEIAAIGAGLLLVLVEVFVVPGFGVVGVAGILLVMGGLIGTFVDNGSRLFPDSPGGTADLLTGLVTVILSVATAGAGMYYMSKYFGSIPVLSRLVLKNDALAEAPPADPLLAAMGPGLSGTARPGDEGVALTPLRPAGRVQVGDRVIDVVADLGFVASGTPVRVVSADRFRVVVEPTRGPTPQEPRA